MDLDSELNKMRRDVAELREAMVTIRPLQSYTPGIGNAPPPTPILDDLIPRLEVRISTIGTAVDALVSQVDALTRRMATAEAAHERHVHEVEDKTSILQTDSMRTGEAPAAPPHTSHPRVHKKKKGHE